MLKIGITGNIACGKSTIGNLLNELGCPIIDSDQVVHQILAQDNQLTRKIIEIVKPTNIVSSTSITSFIDRQALGKILFSNSHVKKQVEEILHPAVSEVVERFFHEAALKGHKAAANLIPLLFETNAEKRFDLVWLIYCDPIVQQKRLSERNTNFNKEEILARINSQMPQEEKLKKANLVIDNSGNLENTKTQVKLAWNNLIK
jgi:dephospho-CoA kinase